MREENRTENKMDKTGKSPMPLEGIRVVEYGVFHAGPGASAILGDLGAEVIKVEEGKGDPERFWKNAGGVDFTMPNGESFMFQISNRNKKGMKLDTRREKGRRIFHRMIQGADVFVTNLRKSTKVALGIDYKSLSRINPRIIYASVSGYGPEGPDSDLGAFDPMGQARSGMTFMTGHEEPIMVNLAVLDQTTAIALSHGILTALLFRERHGVGQEVHVSLLSAGIWFQYTNMMMKGCMGIDQISSDRYRNSPLRNSFRCKDGEWIMGTHHDERHWALICEATEQRELMQDPRFSNDAVRKAHCRELIEHFDKVFATRTRDEWLEILLSRGLMFCPVQRIQEVLADPQAVKNDYVVDFDHPLLGRVKIPGYPVHFSAARAGTRSAGPALGEHTALLLRQMGVSDEEIRELVSEGIIPPEDPNPAR